MYTVFEEKNGAIDIKSGKTKTNITVITIKYSYSLFSSCEPPQSTCRVIQTHLQLHTIHSLSQWRYFKLHIIHAIHHHCHAYHKVDLLLSYFALYFHFNSNWNETHTRSHLLGKAHSKSFAHTSCKYLPSNRSHIL